MSVSVEGRISISVEEALDAIDQLQQKIAELAGEAAEVAVTANTEEAQEGLDEIRASATELDGTHVEIDATANTEEAQADMEATDAQKEDLATPVEIVVGADTSEAEAKLAELEAEKEGASEEGGGGGGSSGGRVSGASSADNLGQSLMRLSVTGPAAGVAIAGAFAALPGILSGVTGAVGGLIAGFMGIGQAIQAYIAVENTASQTGIQMAQNQLSAAQSLQNAASQVTEAETSMAQAQVAAYDQVYNAQIQLTMSEQQLEAAQYGQRASQLSLTEATMQARFQLENYKSQLAGIAIQVQAAQVNIEAAKLALAETLGDPAATQIQRQQAQVSYEQAKQQYSSLLLQQSQLRQEYALASSLGVQGSQQVQAATQGVVSSNYQLQDTNKQVATSKMMLDQAQVQSTQNVQMAQLQLTNAMRNQVFTIKQTALMLEMPIGAYGQLQSAMAALGPAGQQFVHWFMSSFYPVLKQLEFGAEGALLPGIEKALTTMGPYFTAMGKAFDQFDSGFGQFLGRIAAFISSKQGIIEFNAAMHSGLGFMQDMGQAILFVMKGFGQLAVVGAPATQAIGQAIVLLARIFDQWAHSGAMKVIVTGFVDLVNVFDSLFKAMGGAGGLGVLIMMISKFSGFGLVLGGVIAFLPQMMPLFRELMTIMAKLLTEVLGPMMPSLQQLAQLFAQGLAKALLQVMQIVVRLAPELITLLRAFTSFVEWLHPLIPLLLEVMIGFKVFTAAVWLMNIALDANPIGLIILAIGALGFAIFELATHWNAVWHAIVSAAEWAWNWIYGNVLHPLWTFFVGPLIGGINTLGSVFGGIWSGVVSVLQRAWSVIQPIFNGILQAVNTILGPLQRLGSGVSTVFKDLGHVGGAVGNFIGHLFAEGGYVSTPTLGIVGEAGPEVVVPLTNRTRALELLTPLMAPGGALSAPSAGAAASGGGAAPIINIQTMSMADPEMIAQEVAWALKTQMAPGG